MHSTRSHSETPEAVAQALGTGKNGLTAGEAANRLARDGPNSLVEKKKRSKLLVFLDQFKDRMVIILILAAVVSVVLSIVENNNDWWDAIVIMMIVVLNAVFGYVQENRAEEALEALKAMSAPNATVVRGGLVMSVPAKDVVEGDFVILEAGNKVPADIRLVETVSLYINESPLTGESTTVNKDSSSVHKADTLVADRTNMAFSGCLVEMGRGSGYVVATGMRTEVGKIAGLIQEGEREETPLQKNLDKLGKQIGYIVLGVCAIVFIAGLWMHEAGWLEMLLVAVSLAVAAIPEGLPAVVTISLALGLQRMAKKHAIIRHLPAVETLGSAQVICSDKTGTLTKGEMTVRAIWTPGERYEVTGSGFSPEGKVLDAKGAQVGIGHTEAMTIIGRNCLLNSNARLSERDGKWTVQGTATEGALVAFGRKLGGKVESLRLEEIPFDSRRKRMSTLHAVDGTTAMYTKGALDFVLPLCTGILTPDGARPITQLDVDEIHRVNEEMAGKGLRVLSFAYRTGVKKVEERELVFVGLAGLMDPPRPEVIQAVAQCEKAGITVVMITGDHLLTAKAVASEIGIFDEAKHRTLTGAELEKMSDEALEKVVEEVRVYARVSPEHKVKIVKAWKARGKVVAMTGDGVNDAPALKRADIGIAMGITGTDVSKEASVMVLTDDNFASIVDAIEEGRGIFDNIRKFVTFLLACNVGEVFVVFFSILLGLPLPLLALQILWMNLVTDGPPALALGVEPISRGVMDKKPRAKKENILTKEQWTLIILIAFMTFVCTVGMFIYYLPGDWRAIKNDASLSEDERNAEFALARTAAFMTIILAQKFFVLSMKSLDDTFLKSGVFRNPWLLLAILFGALTCIPIIYVPALEEAFGTTRLLWHQWVTIILVALIPFTLSETYKTMRKLCR